LKVRKLLNDKLVELKPEIKEVQYKEMLKEVLDSQ
jgi:hypothetical protein